MRSALAGLFLAATFLTPAAGFAQDDDEASTAREPFHSARQAQREQRQEQRQEARQERTEQRVEQRVEERQQRAEERQQRAEPSPPAPQSAARAEHLERREDRTERRDNRAGATSSYPSAWQGDPNDPARARYERLERRNQYVYGTPEQRETVREDLDAQGRGVPREWQQDRRDERREDWRRDDRRDWRRDWNRHSWRNDHRYDWQSYRYRNRNLFNLGNYYSPYRYHRYSRFNIGFFLEPLFYRRNYWISDPWRYRLPSAPYGTRWVRYYDDVLLVDTWTGEVVDVIYNFFW